MKNKILLLILLSVATLNAEVEDKFKINLGAMFVTNFETEMQLGRAGGFTSSRINTKDQLGMDYETNVFRLDGYYRFNKHHSLDFSYFTVKSTGEKTIAEEIKWGENQDLISIGAQVNSYFNMDIYKLNYVYSFYHNDEVELGLSIGLHVTNLELGLNASGTINGEASKVLLTGSTLVAPLPVIGFRGEYAIIQNRLYAQYKADYFYLNFDDYQGSLIATTFNIEYRFLDNYGVGIGYNSNNLELAADNGNARLDVTNSLTGAMAYISYIY